jgi:Spy/CpxP family protein refolding chaperone
MSELHNVLSEDEIDLSEASDLNARIETIRTGVRLKEIEAFANAKRVLSGEQLERLRSLDAGSSRHESHHGMMDR